jgi:hypothetical protein
MVRVLIAALGSLLLLSCGDGQSPATATPPGPLAPTSPAPTFTISGTVRDDQDRPVEAASVSVYVRFSKTGPGFSTLSDSSGVFRGSLPAGNYDQTVTKAGYQSVERREVVVSGDTRLDVMLRPGVIIGGVVTEVGLDGPLDGLDGVTVTAFSGSEPKLSTTTGPGVPGSYSLRYLLPGTYTIRAGKTGYDTVEQTVDAPADTRVNFSMKWSYGDCLRSVVPFVYDAYASAGGTSTVAVTANPGRSWNATPDVRWVEVLSPAPSRTGSGQMIFRVQANPPGASAPRNGAVMIRCGASEGQNVWITQLPDCQIRLEALPDLPAMFPPAGGGGRLRVRTGVPQCRWRAQSQVSWMHTVGVSDWSGDFDLAFVVLPNTSGAQRTGSILVNETPWQITQRP